MNATMTSMELRFADLLYPNQLMVGDLVKLDNEYLTIFSIVENNDNVNLVLLNDFDEKIEKTIFDNQQIELYVFIDE